MIRAIGLRWSLLAVVVLTAACASPSRAPDQDYRNFQKAIANADQDGYTAYWLGREFIAGGFTFKGPSTGDFGDEVDGGGAQFGYDAIVLPNGGSVGLDITLYSQKAWDKVKAVQGAAPVAGATVTAVSIAGGTGSLVELHNRVGTLEGTWLIIQLGDTTVLAKAGRGNPITPGPDLNPLTDKQTLLSAMQNLRRYPE